MSNHPGKLFLAMTQTAALLSLHPLVSGWNDKVLAELGLRRSVVARADAVNRLCLNSATGVRWRAQPEVDDAAVRLVADVTKHQT